MRRVNIYLGEPELATLRRLGQRRGQPVAALVRQAVGEWLRDQGAETVDEDEWSERFARLLARRRQIARRSRFDESDVERDVAAAVSEVHRRRETRPARRR